MINNNIKEKGCKCGKNHLCNVEKVLVGSGVINSLVEEIKRINVKKAFILCDENTYVAAGQKVENLLKNSNVNYSKFVYNKQNLEPDELSVGMAVMNFDVSCDLVLAVGSGVIGDIAKILANVTKTEYIIVATAPSMDGYASSTSAVARNGLKISLPSKCARVVIGDTDILKNAPLKLLISGLGDMIAKYVSLAEWRISNIINGEYYCEDISNLIKTSLDACVENADGLLNREPKAVELVFEGLVNAGVAMSYAGVSRPASGVEHYISHIIEMRGLEFNEAVSTHGIQCALGTLVASKLYDKLKGETPNYEKGVEYAKNFNIKKWALDLKEFLGNGADAMIELEKKENKYDINAHKNRLNIIIEKWDEILKVINDCIPSSTFIENLLNKIGCPTTFKEINVDEIILPNVLRFTKDIRDKYVLTRLLFDIGVLDEYCQIINK